MSGSLGRRLRAAREMAFVGREEELAVFTTALFSGARSVLYVHGPGGIGKSALLRRFADEAETAGRPVSMLDERLMDPAACPDDAVLLFDGFDRVQILEGWLRERFLPRVPAGALAVIAGRNPPDVRWQADPAWAGSLEVLPLRDLRAADAHTLLDAAGVPAEVHEPLLAFAGGHPLALLLGAAVAAKDGGRWRPDQDLVAELLDQLVGELPSAAHRRALEICAHAYTTTEDLLRAAFPEDSGTLFRWLRRLPFVESSGLGLFPHGVVRRLLEADLRWRDPEAYTVMHERMHARVADRVRTASDADVPGAVAALLHLHHGPPTGDGEFQEEALPQSEAGILVQEAAFWVERQPEAFRLYRSAETGAPVALSAWLRLTELDEEELAADPVVAAAWAHARATTPLRAGEHLAVSRQWVLPPYRGNSLLLELIQWRALGNCLRAERLAWSYIEARTERYHGMRDISGGLFVHDWRAVPAQAWLEQMVKRPASGPGAAAARLAVLSREEFADAVRGALRRLPRPDELATSPLTRTRLVADERNPATALGDLLRQAIGDLSEDPRSVKFHRALSVTFLCGTPTQELAAERLGIPFTTYRRHLAAGIERVCADLWHRELYGTSRT